MKKKNALLQVETAFYAVFQPLNSASQLTNSKFIWCTLADSGSGDDTGGESANLQVNFGSEGSPVQENPSISGEALGHPYVRVTLTEEILLRHNAITEKFFIQQKRETKTMGHHSLTAADAAETFMTGLGINKHYTPVAPGPGITLSTNAAYSRKDSQRLKRCGSHSPDLEKHKLNKHSHAEPSSTVSFNNPIANPAVGLWPPFSMPLSSGEATNCSTAQPHSFLRYLYTIGKNLFSESRVILNADNLLFFNSMNSSNLSLPTPIHSINNKNPSLGNVTFPNYAYFPNGPLNTSLSIEGPQMATHFLMPGMNS